METPHLPTSADTSTLTHLYDGLVRLSVNPSQLSVAWITLAVPWAVTSLLAHESGSELSGLGIFITGRLFDILDGKYARYLMWQKRWSSEWDGATLDSHCDKAWIYAPLILFLCLHGGDNWKTISLVFVSLLMWGLDGKSTLMRTANWSKIARSLRWWADLLIENQNAPLTPNNPANTANGWWKIKATAQTVAVGCILLHESLPEAACAALVLFVTATVCSIVSLRKKAQLQRANALQT